MSGTPVLQAQAATVRMGERMILDAVDLQLFPGEVVALVGPNGAGKSTLLSALSGDLALESGQILIHGRELSQWPVLQLARVRAVQTQESRVSFAFSGQDVVRMGRAPWAGTAEEDRDEQIIAHALAATESLPLAGRTVQTLSGGEKSRVAFARALAQETGLLLLDEPTAPMDIRHQEQLMTLVRQRAAHGASVVVVLHDLTLAAAYADRIVLLDAGRIAASGTPHQVLTETHLEAVYRHRVSVFEHPEHAGLVVLPHRAHLASATSNRQLTEGELI